VNRKIHWLLFLAIFNASAGYSPWPLGEMFETNAEEAEL